MATKSPEATINYLLMCLACTEGKTDWDIVATKTGWYKSGKFSRQAFTSIQKKYEGTVINGENAAATKDNVKEKPKKTTTTKTTNKRTAEDGGEKKGRAKKLKKEAATSKVKDEDETEDELAANGSIDGVED